MIINYIFLLFIYIYIYYNQDGIINYQDDIKAKQCEIQHKLIKKLYNLQKIVNKIIIYILKK